VTLAAPGRTLSSRAAAEGQVIPASRPGTSGPQAAEEHQREVAELDGAVEEAAGVATGRAVLEVDFVLPHPVAGADRVDRHPDLHAEAAGEGEHGAEDVQVAGRVQGRPERQVVAGGVGEGVDDLAPFTASDFAKAIAGIES